MPLQEWRDNNWFTCLKLKKQKIKTTLSSPLLKNAIKKQCISIPHCYKAWWYKKQMFIANITCKIPCEIIQNTSINSLENWDPYNACIKW